MPSVLSSIKHAKESSKLCIVLGAGIAKAVAGLPLWTELMQSFIDFAKSKGIAVDTVQAADLVLSSQPTLAASLLKKPLSDRSTEFRQWLEDTFGNPIVNDQHPVLEVLREIRGDNDLIKFATTNYDLVLEKPLGLTRLNWTADPEDVEAWFRKPENLLHIHGIYDRIKSVIFSSDDYSRLPVTGTDQLPRLLRECVVLFVGCGDTTTDPHFTTAFSELPDDASNSHVLLYRRDPTDTRRAPTHSHITYYPYDKFEALPEVLRSLVLG